jgi:GH35 family endo-1,4-beta-xylanase
MRNHLVYLAIQVILISFWKEIPAKTSEETYDYSHRMRDCEITILTNTGEPIANMLVGITQISNDFVFGGTMHREAFDTLGDEYGDWFRNHFDVATPGDEMKWQHVMKCAEKCESDFSEADFLVDWLVEKKLLIQGHNLFSNEKEGSIPEWTRNLENSAFKQAMIERINTAIDRFKGKVTYWDLINEISHREDGTLFTSSMLETKSGDPDIFGWILDEARKRDSESSFIVSDNAIITSGDLTAADQFINKVKPLSSKYDIVGATGHFGADMDKNSYESKINHIAQKLGKPVWLTDIDFTFDIDKAPDKIEELMRTCFANPNVRGLTIGSWCKRYQSGNGLTNYFIDSLKNETPAGQRWRDVRDEWKTVAVGYTDETGKFKFKGFQGKYQVLLSCYTDTFYLEPGDGIKNVEVSYLSQSPVKYRVTDQKITEIFINGAAVSVRIPPGYAKQLYLTTYSLSGQQVSRSPLNNTNWKHLATPATSNCQIFRIETTGRLPLYTGKITAVR